MARTFKKEALRDATVKLRRYLESVWGNGRISKAARRRQLFELWDECDVRADGPRGQAARIARATVEGFIRRRLPAGSPEAFTEQELADMNRARESATPFDPYGP